MSDINKKAPRRSLHKRTLTSRLLTLLTMVTMLSWANSAWAQTWSAPSEAPEAGATLVDNDDITVKTVYATTAESNYSHDYSDFNFSYSIQVRVDAAPTAETPTGTNKTTTTPLVIKVKNSGVLTLYYRRQADGGSGTTYTAGNGKDVFIIDQTAPTKNLNGAILGGSADGNDYCKETFSLEAGHTYTVWARGTTIRLNGFNYVASAPKWTGFEFDFTGTGNANTIAAAQNTSGSKSTVGISYDSEGNPKEENETPLASFTTYYHGTTYGLQYPTVTFKVPGPVTITIGQTDCSGTAKIKNSLNSDVIELPLLNKTAKYTTSNPVTDSRNYTGGAATITIEDAAYIPYIKVEPYEAPAVIPEYTVTYYDSNGTSILGTQKVTEGEKIGTLAYTASNVTVASGSQFRRWKDKNGKEINANTVVTSNLNVYACVTAEETASATMDYTYDFDQTYYDDEHEIATATVYAKHSSHGWDFKPTSSFAIQVAGPTKIYVGLCQYSGSTMYTLSDGGSFSEEFSATGTDKETKEIDYTGGAGTLTLTANGQAYLHSVRVVGYTPAEPFDVSAELAAQKTPDGWTAVQLPEITLNKTITLEGLSSSDDNAADIQEAIDAVNTAGGGIVRIPAGTWISGPIVMKSNVVLHLSANAKLMMLPYNADSAQGYPHDKSKYFIGTGDASVENVVVEGEGNTSIIDGQGADWWQAYEEKTLEGERPGALVRFAKGSKFLVRNLKFQNSPNTNLTLGNSGDASNFTVHDVTIVNPSSIQNEATADGFTRISHNTDGIPVWGPYTNIYNCTIDTGDDNVVFDSDSRYGHVWNCTFKRGHGASIGSFTERLHHIIFEGITFDGTAQGFRLKTNRTGRSGNGENSVHDVICRNSTMTGVADPFIITSWYDYGSSDNPLPEPSAATAQSVVTTTPEFKDILFQNIEVTNPGTGYSGRNHQYPIYIYGLPEMTVKNVTFDDVQIEGNKGMFMAYCEGVNFINGCKVTNVKAPSSFFELEHEATITGDYGQIPPFKEFEVVMAKGKPGNVITEDAGTNNIEFGIAVDNEGNVSRVAAGASNSVATISGNYNGDHGLTNFKCVTTVPGAVKITVGTCSYDGNAYLKVGSTNIAGPFTGDKSSNCWKNNASNVMYGIYRGTAGEIEITKGGYTPYIKVELFDTDAEPDEDPAGVYDAIVSNVKQLKSALAHSGTASKQYKIFVKNGTYDLQTEYNTAVSNYVTVIGESRDGVLIKNHPTVEGLNTSATFQVASHVVLQNITLQCTVDYNNSTNAERGTALYDNGANNTFRNICLLGRQDTYYSNGNAQSYFEDCEIHGTVDFICGGGNVWFEKCLILLEGRDSGTDVIAAPSTSSDKQGYVFNNCTIDNAEGANMAGKYYLARAWQNEPRCTFSKTAKNIAYAGPWDTKMSSDISDSDIHFTEDADNEATGSKPVEVTAPAAPANVTLNGTTLSWSAVSNAVAYIVYHNGAYLATTTETSFTVPSSARSRVMAKTAGSTPEYSVAAMSAEGVIGEEGEATAGIVLADVTESTTWDWSKTGKTEVKFTAETTIKKDEDFVLSDENALGTLAEFNSAALIGCGEYAVRGGKYFQGSKIMFHTTVAGQIKVSFANTGNRKKDEIEDESLRRFLYVNGEKTQWGSCLATEKDKTTDYIDVEAGDVVLTSKIDGQDADQYLRIFTIEFKANSDVPEPDPSDEGTAGTITWTVGNEAAGTASSEIADVLSNTKVSVGAGLKATTLSSCKANSKAMPQYEPTTSNPGNVTGSMVEYIVRMKKGVTFKPTSISYDAVKCGTDNASYSWSYTIDGSESSITTVAKDNIIRDKNTTGSPTLNHVETINSATAGQTVTVRFYVSGFSTGKNFALGNIKINGIVSGEEEQRTFQDFKIDFRPETYKVILPTTGALPSNVELSNIARNDAQHGLKSGTIKVTVDGPVKFTIGSCQYGSRTMTVKQEGKDDVDIDINNGCDDNTSYNQFVTWTYNVEEPAELSFVVNSYLPWFAAEACEYIPTVDVTYYNTNGTTVLGKETVDGSSALAYKYSESDVTVPEGSKFRGWFDKATGGKKVAEGTILNEDLKLYAVATPIEVATPGSTFTYDLTKDNFYQEDHEGITMTDGKYYNNHGWNFGKGGTIKVPVAGNADLIYTICCYTSEQTITITDNQGNTVNTISFVPEKDGNGNAKESAPFPVRYVGPATTLTFTLPGGGYIHSIEVSNDAIPASDLAVVEGKEVKSLYPGDTYQLKKGESEDYTTSSEGAIIYTSSDEAVATVSETGLITAGSKYGSATITVAQAGNASFQEGRKEFTVKVINQYGQSAKPSASVSDDGKVYLTANTDEPDAKIYYTTDGTEPTDQSTPYTGEITGLTENTIVKAVAYYDVKSPSDIVNVYYKVPVTLKWSGTAFKLTYDDESLQPLFDENTSLQLGTKLNNTGSTFSTNDNPAISYARIASKEMNNNRDKDLSLRFNVLTKAGLGFKPTEVSFTSSRGGTNGGKLDVTYESEELEAVLFTDVTPNRCNNDTAPNDGSGKFHTTYNYSNGELSSLGFSDDASLYIYQKGLNVGVYYGYDDITITGLISGSEYDGEFYKVAYDIEPAESGYVVQKPSTASVMAGKQVTFEATPAEGYKFVNWTKMVDNSELSTDAKLSRTITEDTYITANFQKLPLVTFSKDLPGVEIEGNVPSAQYVDAETYELFLPVNYVLYREGFTMIGWTDGETIYDLNKAYRFDTDVTLKPKFTVNSIDITEANEKVTVRWDLNHRDRPENSPEINVAYKENDPENNKGIYTRTATVNGTPIDLKIDIVAPGVDTKLDNRDGTVPVSTAQVNPGTKVTIPAVPGMKVTLKASTGKDERTITGRTSPRHTQFVEGKTIPSFFGDDTNANPTRVDDYTAQYIYNGDDKTVTLTFQQIEGQGDWGFYEWIEVEYPVLKDIQFANSIQEKLEREKVENAGVLEAAVPAHANTGKRYLANDVVTVTATAKYGYTITGFTCAAGESNLAGLNIADGGKSATVRYTVVDGENLVTAVYQRQQTYAIHVSTADNSLGEVTLSPLYENFVKRGSDYVEGYYVEGTEVKLVSDAGEGNVLEYWMDGENNWIDGGGNPTQKSPTVKKTIASSDPGIAYYTAHFKPGEKGTVIFDLTDSGVDVDPETYSGSMSIQPATLSGVRSFNIPTNFTFFRNGYSLDHWETAGGEVYKLGQRGSFTEADQVINLKPVFTENPGTQENRVNNPVIRYDFGSGIFNYDDPTSESTRKVSAQKVDIGKNTKTFWTSTVFTKILVNGDKKPHWRDVAMWVNTGEKGFIRNGDLPDWAAFGPGTIFEIASCSGTKFSIMTYAPITTTTIDGVVPTLDEARSNPANHEYVYTYTTRSAEDRVKIIIGDDYSYYKWIEAATLAANMVDLHIKTSDKVVGEITSVESYNEELSPSVLLEDGGKSFQKGSKVVVTFYRKFGAEFDKIIDPAKNDLPVLEMLSDDKVSMVLKGNGTDTEVLSPNDDGTWGGGQDHVFKLSVSNATDEEKAKGYLTKYTVEFEITTHRDLEIIFKEKPTYYVTFNTGKEAIGVAPSAIWLEAGDKYTIPKNQTLYYEGHTLDHWIDLDGNVYTIGAESTMSAVKPSDMLLYPVFRQNMFSLLDLTGDAMATWTLARGNGAPILSYQRINGIYIAQVNNGESEIDVKLDLIGENGKIDNKAGMERAQINGGSIFRFPVTDQCVIGLNASSPSYAIEKTLICGKNASDGGYEKAQNVTSTYSGEAGQGDVVFADDGKYYTEFSITYKSQTTTIKPELASVAYGETTLTAEQLSSLTTKGSIEFTVDADVVTNRVPAVTAEVNNGKVEIEQATYSNPVAMVNVLTNGGMSVKSYAVNFKFNTPATAPQLASVKVRNATVSNNVAADAPVSGSIEITFDRIMKPADITPTVGDKDLSPISASQGKVLTYSYWNLPVDKDVVITIPANTLEDVYGAKYALPIVLTLHTAATNIAVEHKPFDYVVGYGSVTDINDIINAVNATKGTERLRIFIPDGEYELKGNEISSWKAGDETTDDEGNSLKIPAGGFKYNNHMTAIHRSNVSLIGQSQDGTVIYNRPKYEGIGATATIHLNGVDGYLEDLTLENRYPYNKANFAGRAVAFCDQGNRQVLKNVSLMSHQDTYYSHGSGNYRGYFEDCVLAGTVDWLCGNGDIWLERCGLMVRNRAGNNIAAPYTQTSWGYVFNNCRIYAEDGADLVTDKSYTLGRPWGGTPGATYLNTTFDVLPRDEGWQAMMESHVLKFHEYNSMDKYGHPITLGTRTLAGAAPLKGSDDIILTEAAAQKYTVENVVGGGEAFDPRVYTQQIDAESARSGKDENNSITWKDGIQLDDDVLSWNVDPMALCYFIFKVNEETGKMEYVTNVAQTSDESTMGVSLERLGRGEGLYCVRAANQRGGLGAATDTIRYKESAKYELEIRPLEGNEVAKGYGWTTICLPYNAKKPMQSVDGVDCSGTLKMFAVNGKGDNKTTTKYSVSDYSVYLTEVEVMNENEGYLIYGPVGKYQFSSTSHKTTVPTILKGNPADEQIAKGNNNGYVLANKPTTWGLGFYRYTGDWLAAHRAWLPIEYVTPQVESVLSSNARAIKFIFTDDELTGILNPIVDIADGEVIYDLQGQRIVRSQMRKGSVYIINGKKQLVK